MNPSRLAAIATILLFVVTPLAAKPAKEKKGKGGRCSLAHYPIAVGDVNEYRMTSNHLDAGKKVIGSTSYTYKDEILSVDADGFRSKSVSESNTSETRWRCTEQGIELQFDEYPETKIIATGPTIPATMTIGESWVQTFETVSASSSMKSKTVNRITKRETVSVPNGTFEAYRVDYETETSAPDQPPSVARGTQWFVTDVGIVKSSSVIDMDAGEIQRIETTIELVKRTTK